MKSLRSTLALLLIVAAVGGYIYFNERGPVAQSGNKVLLRVDPARAESISLRQAGESIVFSKKENQWRVQGEAPVALPADPDAVKSLLDQVQLLQTPAVLPSTPDKLKEYGLDTPRSTLKVGEATISFGKQPAFDMTRVYARVENGGSTLVGLVPSALGNAALKPLDAWRDKAVLRVNVEETSQVQIKAPAINVVFEREVTSRDGARSWNITRPLQVRADSGIVRSFLDQLPQTQATRFLEDVPRAPARWGLDKPLAVVQVVNGDTTSVLRIGRRTKGGYAAQNSISPSVFEVPDTLFALINRPLNQWRSRALLGFEIDRATQLEIEARGQSLSFRNSNDKWGIDAGSTPADAQAQHQAVLDILLALQGVNAQEFIDAPQSIEAYGLDKPILQLKLSSSQWSGTKTLSIATAGGKAYGRLAGSDGADKTVYVLLPSILNAFNPALDILFPQAKPATAKPRTTAPAK